MCPHQHSPKESRNSPTQGACWSSYRIKDSCQFVTCMVCFGYFCYRKFDCCLSCFVSSFSLKWNENRKLSTILEWQLRNKKQMTLWLSCLDVFFLHSWLLFVNFIAVNLLVCLCIAICWFVVFGMNFQVCCCCCRSYLQSETCCCCCFFFTLETFPNEAFVSN